MHPVDTATPQVSRIVLLQGRRVEDIVTAAIHASRSSAYRTTNISCCQSAHAIMVTMTTMMRTAHA
jgi:hypothetical protein